MSKAGEEIAINVYGEGDVKSSSSSSNLARFEITKWQQNDECVEGEAAICGARCEGHLGSFNQGCHWCY
jgi:hypothetical protein